MLVTLGVVSVDGSKFEAAASKHRSVRYDRAGELIDRLRLEIADLMERAKAERAAYEAKVSTQSGSTGERRFGDRPNPIPAVTSNLERAAADDGQIVHNRNPTPKSDRLIARISHERSVMKVANASNGRRRLV